MARNPGEIDLQRLAERSEFKALIDGQLPGGIAGMVPNFENQDTTELEAEPDTEELPPADVVPNA